MSSGASESSPLPRPGAGVVFQRVPDGAVLFSSATETYFGLNTVGAEAWELLPPASRTLGELTTALLEKHPEVDEATVRTDIQELLDELRKLGLVVDDGAAG